VLTRVGTQPGDRVYASGSLGAGSALAATALLGIGKELYREQDYRPKVRLREGVALRGVASACMDTSDGLLATLDQLARINEVAIRVTTPLPELLEPKAAAMQRELGLPAFAFLAAIHGEFELVFSVPEARVPALERASAAIGWQPLLVGRAEPGHGVSIGGQAIDSAEIRNLFDESAGDLSAYAARLLAVKVE
jgi:thiamine-monophosphate kinase